MLDKLTPPDTAEGKWRWYLAIAVAVIFVNSMAGRGLLGFGEFASAEELQKQGTKMDRILILQIAGNLRDLKREECRANGNKQIIQKTIEDYQEQYRALAGIRFPLGDCEHQ